MSNTKHYIYIHVNLVNNKIYVGQCKGDPKIRWGFCGNGYLHKRKDGTYGQALFARAIIKYGWDNFEHTVLKEVDTKAEADEYEIFFIKILQTQNPLYGYNINSGGSGNPGFKHTEEAKKKISEYQRNKVMTKEWCEHISLGKRGHEVSQSTRDKISQTLKGQYVGEKHPNYGKPVSQETRDKISKGNKGKTAGYKNPKATPVYCIELNKFYFTLTEAGRDLQINFKNISAVLRGKQVTTGGYHWRYATEEEIQNEILKNGK